LEVHIFTKLTFHLSKKRRRTGKKTYCFQCQGEYLIEVVYICKQSVGYLDAGQLNYQLHMKLAAANTKLESIIKNVEKSGIKAEGLVEELRGLREFALKEKDPLVTKVLRLTYEYLSEKSTFDVQAQFEEDEEENEYPIEIEDNENFLYLLNLLLRSDHKVNREEIKDYRSALKLELY
jgi:hypothetical protein